MYRLKKRPNSCALKESRTQKNIFDDIFRDKKVELCYSFATDGVHCTLYIHCDPKNKNKWLQCHHQIYIIQDKFSGQL